VKQVTAICDSGAEISCVNSKLIQDLAPTMFGELQLRTFCGSPVVAKLTRLTVSCCNFSSIDIWCAVVSGLHDKLLLSADVVDHLSRCDANISRVTTRNSDNDDQDVRNDISSDSVNVSVADVDADNDNDDIMMQSPVSVDDAVSSDVKSNRNVTILEHRIGDYR